MAFTYVDPTSGDRDKVRFLIQDTDSTDAHLQDAEITYLITVWGNVYAAAAYAAETIAAKYSHKTNYSRSIGDLSISESYSESATQFRELAKSLREQELDLFPPTTKINASAIIATADKLVTTYKTDFYTGMHDYTV
jgi:hypothetical protein